MEEESAETGVKTRLRKTYSNGHSFHIHSLSPNSDGETFLSADDLRINIWHYEVVDTSFLALDIKPVNMEELTEVITTASFHPHDCHQLMFTNSKEIGRASCRERV